MPQIRVSDEVHRRLLEYAGGRPLGMAIGMLLDAENDWVRVEANTTPPETVYDGLVLAGEPATPLDPEGKPTARPRPVAGMLRRRGLLDHALEHDGRVPDDNPGEPICTCTPAERRRPKGRPHKLGCPRKGLD